MKNVERFFDYSLELMCVAGMDGFFNRVNPAFQDAFGYTEEELTTVPYLGFFHPEDRGAVVRQGEAAARGEKTFDFEARFLHKNGTVHWLSWRANSIEGKLYVTARDISRFKEAETDFRETFENAGVGLAHARVDGTLLLVNQELCSMLGYSRQDLLELNYYSLLGPGDVSTPPQDRTALETGRIHKIVRERPLLRKDKSVVWTLITVTVIRDSQGAPRHYILAHKDITHRRSVEESFRALVEAIPQIVWTASAGGEIDFFNRRWYDYTALTERSGTPGDSWQLALHPEDAERSGSLWREAVAQGASYECECRLRDGRTGAYRWQLARALPLLDKGGEIVRWFGTYTDIDDQKRAQEQLRQSFGELKRSSEERAQLIAKERAATEASRLKSEFLATMTHEIRTPLNGVVAMAGLLLGSSLNPSQREYAETIAQSADALLALVNDILDFSKIEAGKLDLEHVDFDLAELATSAVRVMEASAAAKGIPLHLESGEAVDGRVLLRGDPSRVRQVIFNLLHNAVKFTARGHVTFRYRVTPLAPERVNVRFEVTDTGIGIEAHAIRRIWADFEQADASTTRRYGGTGLGLAICRRLIDRMGGTIGVESQPESGSTFWFEVPFEIGRAIASHSRSRTGAAPSDADRKLRILVAEDHPINQKVIRRILESQGQHVDLVADGEEALSAVAGAPYDLVILDCHMPRMDGFEAARAIRSSKDARIARLPIIALTADVMAGTREKCVAAGMDRYCTKPIDAEELRAAMQAVMEGPIDSAALDRLSAANAPGMPDLVQELIGDFLEQAPASLARIREALAGSDAARIASESHALKSVAATLGAGRLAAVCQKLEELGRSGATRQALHCLGELDEEADTALRTLAGFGQKS